MNEIEQHIRLDQHIRLECLKLAAERSEYGNSADSVVQAAEIFAGFVLGARAADTPERHLGEIPF